MKLNLGASKPPARSYHEEATEHSELVVTVEIEGGSSSSSLTWSVSSGETVAMLKKRICDSQGLAYSALSLSFEDTKLIDPLSFNDIKQIRGKTAVTIKCLVKA